MSKKLAIYSLLVTLFILSVYNIVYDFTAPSTTWGDINQDGVVNECDLCDIKLVLVGSNEVDLSISDLNGDGKFSLADVVTLKLYLQKEKGS